MPTLKLIAFTPTIKEEGNGSRGASPNQSSAEDCPDDRFSQTPNEVTNTRQKSHVAPFSIAAATRNHRTRTGKNSRTNGSGSGSSATDIVAVVLSSAIHASSQSRVPKYIGARFHLLLGDPSLACGQCARVDVAVSSSNVSPVAENRHVAGRMGPLRPGDVVRCYRFEVRKTYDDASPNQKRQRMTQASDEADVPAGARHHPLLRVICDLSSSWTDPAAGHSLARLCRILPKEDNRYDLEWETIVPPSMGLPKDVVGELASWYCANARRHFSKSTLPTQKPCQRRRLREITVSNMLSHVVVTVLRCEKATATYSTPCKKAEDPVVTHVTLSDGVESDDLLGMGGPVNPGRLVGTVSSLPRSISAILLQSMIEGSHVLVTYALSQSASPIAIGGGASLYGRESLVLTPTRETTATILTRDHPYFPTSTREVQNPFASQSLTVERATQLFSMTQQNSPSVIDSKPANQSRGLMVVVAPLMDIIVDGVSTSFMEGVHWQTPHQLSRFLINNPSVSTGFEAIKLRPSYRSATLILEPLQVSRDIVVNADGNALKLLCMDVPIEDMIETIAPNPYLCHVGALLRALCSDSAPIRWIIEQESEFSWFVTNATLLDI